MPVSPDCRPAARHIIRPRSRYGAATAIALVLSAPVMAQAQQPQASQAQTQAQPNTVAFSIPAGPLAAGLTAFGVQSGLQVLYAADLTRDRTAPAVSGSLSPDAALQALLAGSGLTFQYTGPATITLLQAPAAVPGAISLSPLAVQGQHDRYSGWPEASRTTVTPEDLERKNPGDVRRVFAGETAVRVGGSIPMSEKVYVHGVEETNLAVSIDGSRQNNKVFHHNGTTLIDPSYLKVARVDSGVAPADAGPGALAGAIAYETKDARDFLDANGVGGMVKTSYNTNGNVSTNNAGVYARQDWADVMASATYAKGGKFKDGHGDKVRGSATDMQSGLGKLGLQADSGDRVEVSAERVRDSSNRPYRGNIGNITGRPAWEPKERQYTLERDNLTLSYSDATPTDLWNPKVVMARSGTNVTLPIVTSSTSYTGEGETTSLNGKAENTFTFAIGTVTLGTDFYRDRAGYQDRTMAAKEKADNTGLYAQARLNPVDPLHLSFGVRNDWQTFTGTTGQEWEQSGASPNVSGELDVVPGLLKAKAGYAHVWSGVPLAENFIMNPAWTYATAPRAVQSDNVTAGLELTHSGFTVDWQVFQTKMDDVRAAKFSAASSTLTRDVLSQGYEAGVRYAWDNGFARIAYADTDVTIDGQPADSDTGTYIATPMGKVISLAAEHVFRDAGITVGGDVDIVRDNNKAAPGNQPLKGYEVFNLYAAYQLPGSLSNVSLRADVLNLFDAVYADRATYGQEFSTVTPLYQPGRSFLLTATATF
ncbi:TonB-dependent receptor [Novispirillum itersonii]|uniref:TonB-dependent receptor n=1 Tax=Novispirillum itersonii TaxID=189 RepID=UPI000371A157|nr:TonB-dependent receptor [Novispirillum itersonii]